MLGQVIRQLQEILERKAKSVQSSFTAISKQMSDLSSDMHRLSGEEHKQALAEQNELRARQQEVAQEVNHWREYARQIVLQGGEKRLQKFVEGILPHADAELEVELKDILFLLQNPEEMQLRFDQANSQLDLRTPVARLVERARTNYDIRQVDDRARREAAVEFAGRQGILQNQEVITELETVLETETDEYVLETIQFTIIQIYRYRAVRLADMDVAHDAVKRMTRFSHPIVIPALIDVLENPRSGFSEKNGHSETVENIRSRTICLLRLVEWHTPEARQAIYLRRFDKDQGIANLAEKAISLFPGEWAGESDISLPASIDV